jgi:predicted metallo-beta-lactamase superfamily hydrolase
MNENENGKLQRQPEIREARIYVVVAEEGRSATGLMSVTKLVSLADAKVLLAAAIGITPTRPLPPQRRIPKAMTARGKDILP